MIVLLSVKVSFFRVLHRYTMHNSYDVKPSDDATVTTVPHQRMHESEAAGKATENTSLSPANNQTYFADERVQVPETGHVSQPS